MKRSIFVGYDPREQDAFQVCMTSIARHLTEDIPVYAVVLHGLQAMGLYQRPTLLKDGQLWDVISDAPMSTEFAVSRFFVPRLAREGMALFMDCDTLVRCDLAELFDAADPSKAVSVVQHNHEPLDRVKMDGQLQTRYERKNWSSVCLWNVDHPANRQLTDAKVNSWAGRALHRFAWLEDSEIGALDPAWNHLVGVAAPDCAARIVHFTLGIPSMPGFENCEYAEEWRSLCPAQL